eukprot:CAMPEP_0201550290 /NCGR_PEP_ID=MMETSP0173_2-20130828/6671_1 /ASSEMBLY_ACC=CAM_ASM_000268 /TAXON_ID=218659 /ORGANISM="Vexillifera sp., Strain DIVA3 564/2" /LENGTH=92 /DNA_ID=CAMNT_0047960223 /DNA_START=1460 /DNA_END=1738 /DNA_ORIENTATION=-
MSSSRYNESFSPSSSISVPEYSDKYTLSPAAKTGGTTVPSFVVRPVPTASTSPCWLEPFLTTSSGNTIPPTVFDGGATLRINTRSNNGRIRL